MMSGHTNRDLLTWKPLVATVTGITQDRQKKFRPQLYDVAAAEAGKLPVRSCVQVTASSSCWRISDQISWQERTAKVNRALTWA